MSFLLLLNIDAILKKVENQVAGPQWLAYYYYFSYFQSQFTMFFKISSFNTKEDILIAIKNTLLQVWDNVSE